MIAYRLHIASLILSPGLHGFPPGPNQRAIFYRGLPHDTASRRKGGQPRRRGQGGGWHFRPRFLKMQMHLLRRYALFP